MNLSEIEELIKEFKASDLGHLKLKHEHFELVLDKESAYTKHKNALNSARSSAPIQAPIMVEASMPSVQTPVPMVCTPIVDKKEDFVLSPMVGTFYHAPSPGAEPYVKAGDTLKKGQIIGIVEAMKIMNEIEVEYPCKVVSIEVGDAQPVEYGTKLIKVEKL
ncbi:acetyl-CoA carboxylase biotin carboxyl carrier protein [Helicobacter pylori]|uniref:Biotin carboxyl carrier protein of acetyl-CoA carboxylase n=2 Tax=Helicobacter pylori TaxID=210 RepID=M3N8E2_HELPX|nr:acetyl-CoA carboxylase biotin carboxyl carrier protein [Helicobacter pylori]EJB80903.1 acetyl-CoA carboxylase, biotin carboxyl carrier protein [Helicobacter pylori Hp H-6]EMH05356.1 acetyl-CoA carboxylase, biotin carboxyl carrier protein [Helicobacter pylori GAM245Ai]EMH24359.1 acetyl-CoA carboxylase, biotin carboxyl carrier protein [Helicobacter pylori GAM260BSi]EMH66559.1 acetyl-CoA carboxylase, biotin carboxyl carrier protein [Helicobacter pylori HP260BFii]MBH0286355.1 acetyl-CoA carboxy